MAVMGECKVSIPAVEQPHVFLYPERLDAGTTIRDPKHRYTHVSKSAFLAALYVPKTTTATPSPN